MPPATFSTISPVMYGAMPHAVSTTSAVIDSEQRTRKTITNQN